MSIYLKFCLALVVVAWGMSTVHGQVTKYWDTTAGAGNGVGGSGTWGTTFSNSSTGDAALSSAATTDNLIFTGTAGTVTLGANQTAGSLTFSTTNYKITGSTTATRTITGPLTLDPNINLIVGGGETADRIIGFAGTINGGTGATISIDAAATGTAHTRLNFANANSTISVPITLTNTGFAAIVSTASSVTIAGSITGNGSRFNIGATSGNSLNLNSTLNNGTGAIRIAAGGSGGAGVVLFSTSGHTFSSLELNNAASGIVRMGIANALPTGSTLAFGATSGNGDSIFETNGFNTTIGQLTNLVQSGGTLRNTNAVAATLTISGSDASANAASVSLQDGTGGGALSLVRSGTGSTTLSSITNSYSGGTTISGGFLVAANASGSATGTGVVTVNSGGTLAGSGFLTGATTVNSNGIIRGGSGAGTGTLTTGNVTVQNGGIIFANLAASGTSSQLALGANTLDLKTGSVLKLANVNGFNATSGATWTIAQLTSGTTLQLDAAGQADGFQFGSYTQGSGNTGPVNIDVTGLPSLSTGDQLILSRTGNSLVLTFVPVPEPALLFGLAAGLMGVGAAVRKKFFAPATSA